MFIIFFFYVSGIEAFLLTYLWPILKKELQKLLPVPGGRVVVKQNYLLPIQYGTGVANKFLPNIVHLLTRSILQQSLKQFIGKFRSPRALTYVNLLTSTAIPLVHSSEKIYLLFKIIVEHTIRNTTSFLNWFRHSHQNRSIIYILFDFLNIKFLFLIQIILFLCLL